MLVFCCWRCHWCFSTRPAFSRWEVSDKSEKAREAEGVRVRANVRCWWSVCHYAAGSGWRPIFEMCPWNLSSTRSCHCCCRWLSTQWHESLLYFEPRIWNPHCRSHLFTWWVWRNPCHLPSSPWKKKTPVFLGPVLIHYRKTFATYLFLTSCWIV